MVNRPFYSRLYPVDKLPNKGANVRYELDDEEKEQLARHLKIPQIHKFEAVLKITGSARKAHVTGYVNGHIMQQCGVTLELFEVSFQEVIDEEFLYEPKNKIDSDAELFPEEEYDRIINNKIDIGSLCVEFFVLGLDPFPRKPGVEFTYTNNDAKDSPFAKLKQLKK